MSDSGEHEYEIGAIPAAIFTEGLDFDQEVNLQTINECIVRGEEYTKAMAAGNEELVHQFEPLVRVLYGISYGSIVPIMKQIQEGKDEGAAIRSVIAGVGGLMFFGGIEYAKAMGLHGVGVTLPQKEYAEDVYPEEKPLGEGHSLEDILRTNFPEGEEE